MKPLFWKPLLFRCCGPLLRLQLSVPHSVHFTATTGHLPHPAEGVLSGTLGLKCYVSHRTFATPRAEGVLSGTLALKCYVTGGPFRKFT